MKIVVTKCSGLLYWYSDRIGETFDVQYVGESYYRIGLPEQRIYNIMYKIDCITLEELRQNKLNEILDGEVKSSMH